MLNIYNLDQQQVANELLKDKILLVDATLDFTIEDLKTMWIEAKTI